MFFWWLFSVGQLWGVTHNRRAGLSPYVTKNSIDPNLGVIRIDDLNGNSFLIFLFSKMNKNMFLWGGFDFDFEGSSFFWRVYE